MLPQLAFADDNEVAATAARVEEANAEYEAATAHLEDVQAEIEANEARIAEISAQLPAQRAKSAESIRTLYKMQQSSGGLIDLVLTSDSFDTVLSTVQYLNVISDKNTAEVDRLVDMEHELQTVQTSLEADKQEALSAQQDAQTALDEAEAARKEAQERAAAQAAAEAKAAEEALAAARAAAEQQATFTTESGNTVQVSASENASAGVAEVSYDAPAAATTSSSSTTTATNAPAATEGGSTTTESSSSSSSAASSSASSAAISSDSLDSWASRIDAYLAGSPLAGQGRTFAQAALTYGVDPRWSPAISCIESSKGLYCFLPHNAWGWGSVSWDSWEEAINAHVKGLASGYGYTITYASAQKYCPPNCDYWYSSVLSEMESI